MGHRHYERVPGRFQVEFRSTSSLLVAYSVNLSRGGVFLQCDELPPVGTPLALDIALPNKQVVAMTGIVTWHRASADQSGPRGIGVRFETMVDELGLIIDSMVSDFAGITILVQCADERDRRSLLRMLKSIIGTAEVVFADGYDTASNLLGDDNIDLLVVDVDESANDGLATLHVSAAEHDIPCIALVSDQQLIDRAVQSGADQIVGNPPNAMALRKAVMQLLSSPRRVSQTSA
jgi:uncharacterized protein (TIGR02266 family)